jgi:hypothetical protein
MLAVAVVIHDPDQQQLVVPAEVVIAIHLDL